MVWLLLVLVALLSVAVLVLARHVAPRKAQSSGLSASYSAASSDVGVARPDPPDRERFDHPVESFIERGDSLAVLHPDDPELALVFGAGSESLGSVVGPVPAQLAQVAVGTNALVQAGVSMGEQAGMLVRLTPESARRFKELNHVKDGSGAVLAVFRGSDARFRHVARFKPQRGLQAASGVTNALSAVAMQAQLAAIERAIADVADLVKSVVGKLDDRFQAELTATEGLLRETYRAASSSGYLSDLMWDQIAPLALLVRQNQEFADRQLRRLGAELHAKKSVKDRKSWLKSKRGEVQEALQSIERASRMSAQFGSLRLWRLSVVNDVALPFYAQELREQLPTREDAVRQLHVTLLETLERQQPGAWTSFHSPFDSRRVRGMLRDVQSLLDEVAPPPTLTNIVEKAEAPAIEEPDAVGETTVDDMPPWTSRASPTLRRPTDPVGRSGQRPN